MKLSIFPEAKAHPSSKAEKVTESFKVSKPYLPKTVTIATEDDLIKFVTSYAWSPFVFDGVRHADNFVSCDFLVYDIDEGLTIDGADNILSGTNYCYLILPSPSHTETNHRFRIIIPLAHSILDAETYLASWQAGADILGSVDEQTKDLARYFFGSTDNGWGCWDFTKDFFTPIKKAIPGKSDFVTHSHTVMISITDDLKDVVEKLYGEKRDKVPEAVEYFLKNAHTGLPGNWINSLNAAAFSLALSGVDEEVITEVFEQLAPDGGLDSKDMYQIRRAVRDGHKASEN